jgi:hypothetical protein
MKRRIICLAGSIAFIVSIASIGLTTLNFRPCPVDVRPETLARLEIGMTESEIEALLCAPPGDYTSEPGVAYGFAGSWLCDDAVEELDQRPTSEWRTDQYDIIVYFEPNGKAVEIEFGRAFITRPSMGYPTPLRQMLHPFIDP